MGYKSYVDKDPRAFREGPAAEELTVGLHEYAGPPTDRVPEEIMDSVIRERDERIEAWMNQVKAFIRAIDVKNL